MGTENKYTRYKKKVCCYVCKDPQEIKSTVFYSVKLQSFIKPNKMLENVLKLYTFSMDILGICFKYFTQEVHWNRLTKGLCKGFTQFFNFICTILLLKDCIITKQFNKKKVSANNEKVSSYSHEQ